MHVHSISYLRLYFLHRIIVYCFSSEVKGDCSLKPSESGIGTGLASDINAECKYNSQTQKFYYSISWKAPEPKKEPVSAYRVEVMYEIWQRYCFQLSEVNTYFEFNESVGFRYGERMKYAVTPEPVVLHGGSISTITKKAVQCPIAPELIPLPNVVVDISSSFYFKCKFVVNPVPRPVINWLFTKDNRNCEKEKQIVKNNKHIHISADNRTLKIINVNREHIGCYIVTAYNGVGDSQEEKGFLNLNMTKVLLTQKLKNQREKKELTTIAVIITVALIVTSVVGVVSYICYRRNKTSFRLTDLRGN